MRRTSGYVFLFSLCVILGGCPWTRSAKFTSADVGAAGLGREVIDDASEAPGGAEGEGDGTGAAAPERTVTEPDVIRRDGNILYVLNQFRGLTAVDLDTHAVVGEAPTYGFPRDLYLVGDLAYVLVSSAQNFAIAEKTITADMGSKIYVIDVGDLASAEIVGTFDLEGDLVDSRLVGDVLYAVTSEYAYYGIDDGTGVVEAKGNSGDSTITSLNVANPESIVVADTLAFDGQGTVIQATSSGIYVAAPDFATGNTNITHVDISDPAGAMTAIGSSEVRGQVADRFKMDAYNGVLRVVSNAWDAQREVYVTTIDLATLTTLAEMNLATASGDQLFAVRFDGDRAYVVTYFVVDPLYVLDLSDPANPSILGELEVPGFSTHIEPRGDRLIALGVDDSEGGRRVSVSIFDVAGVPALVDRVSFGDDWSWSTALQDVKAFTVLEDLLIVPFSGWSGEFGGYERLQFVSYTLNDLETRGYVDLYGTILRSFEYDGGYFGVTSENVAVIDATDLDAPEVTATITLAENIVDVIEAGNGVVVEVISRYDDGVTLIRTLDENLDPVGEAAVEIGSFHGLYAAGSNLAVVGTVWENSNSYRVAIVNVETPDSPLVVAVTQVDVQPFYGYYHYGPYAIEPFTDVAGVASTKSLFAPWPFPYGNGDSGFVLDNTLALRCFATEFDRSFGPDEAHEGVALVDLTSGEWTETVGLGFDSITALDAAGSRLYVGTKVFATDLDPATGPLCSYYLRQLDVLGEVEGPAVNVPGDFLQYDPASNVLVVRDYQWDETYYVQTTLRSLDWDGGDSVDVIDAVEMPQYAGNIVAAGDNLFFDYYTGSGYAIAAIDVSSEGILIAGEPVDVTDYWGNLVGGDGDDAYVTIGGGSVAHYEFIDGIGTLADLTPMMGTPANIRFSDNRALAPLGYFGLVELPR